MDHTWPWLKGLRVQEARLAARIKELEVSTSTQAAELKGKTEEHSTTAGTLERAKIAMEQKERTVDDIRKDLERQGLEGDQHLADQARAELEARVGADGQCSPRHQTHLLSSFIESTDMQGLIDSARHVIKRTLNPRSMASYDVANTIHESLGAGGGAGRQARERPPAAQPQGRV
jgi:hypothetical protein